MYTLFYTVSREGDELNFQTMDEKFTASLTYEEYRTFDDMMFAKFVTVTLENMSETYEAEAKLAGPIEFTADDQTFSQKIVVGDQVLVVRANLSHSATLSIALKHFAK